MTDMFDDVGKFHKKFGLPHYGDGLPPRFLSEDVLKFRIKFMTEELGEFVDTHGDGDLAGAADAIADLVYVALGTAHMMGIPMHHVWQEVQRANMTKLRASGADDPASTRKHVLDVVKPPGFVPPDHAPALARADMMAKAPKRGCTYPTCDCPPIPWDYKEQRRQPPAALCRGPEEPVVLSRGNAWWDQWFLGMAEYAATASKDPSTRVGAVVVARDDRRKTSIGYNGFPPGITDDTARLGDRDKKYKLMMHAERNALDNATFDCVGATLYCGVPPCIECAKSIVSRRIARIVTRPFPPVEKGRWTEQIPEALATLNEAGVVLVVMEGAA